MKVVNKIFFLSIFIIAYQVALVFAQSTVQNDAVKIGEQQSTPNVMQLTAKAVSDDAIKKGNITAAISYVKEKLASTAELSDPIEVRSLYIFLGGLQESAGLYGDAKSSYIKAAGIAGKDADGMTPRSNELLVIDAVRMALATGEGNEALTYLASAVKNSKDSYVQALVKLYSQWALLCLEQTDAKEKECIKTLKQYAVTESMKSVRLSVLFTLWYITGDLDYGKQIVTLAPQSTEASIVEGVTQIMPSPFWYFIPHNRINTIAKSSPNTTTAPVASSAGDSKTTKTVVTVQTVHTGPAGVPGYITADDANEDKSIVIDSDSASDVEVDTSERPVKQQLGLFRDKNNALGYVEKVRGKGFNAYISEVTKPSGNIYYSVLVDEDKSGGMGLRLKSAGFECYPIYSK